MLSVTHGDQVSYSWAAGNSERIYTVRRGNKVAIIDNWPIYDWTLQVQKTDGISFTLHIDCIERLITEASGEIASHQMHNEVYRAVEDAFPERELRDSEVMFFDTGFGTMVPNPNYDS